MQKFFKIITTRRYWYSQSRKHGWDGSRGSRANKHACSTLTKFTNRPGNIIVSGLPPPSMILSMMICLRSEDKGFPGIQRPLSLTVNMFTLCNAPFLRQNAIIPRLATSDNLPRIPRLATPDNLPRKATNQLWLPFEMHWKLSSKAGIASDFSTLLGVKQGEKRKRCHSEIGFSTLTSDVFFDQKPNKQTSHE